MAIDWISFPRDMAEIALLAVGIDPEDVKERDTVAAALSKRINYLRCGGGNSIAGVEPAEWTKEPPTEPGWYWIYSSKKTELASVRLYKSNPSDWNNLFDGLVVDLVEIQVTLPDLVSQEYGWQWMKLVVPQPPKE